LVSPSIRNVTLPDEAPEAGCGTRSDIESCFGSPEKSGCLQKGNSAHPAMPDERS